jgi:hypothetical protein
MEKITMNTALVNPRRAFMPTFTLVLAGGAAVLAVIAIAADDVGSAQPPTTSTRVTIVGPAHPLGATSVGIPCDQLVFTRC